MAESRYVSTSEDPYAAKHSRVDKLLADPTILLLSNRKIAAIARVDESFVRAKRKMLEAKQGKEPDKKQKAKTKTKTDSGE